jgi:hypothetical protein
MKRINYILIAVVIVAASFWKDIDYCIYTSRSRTTWRFMGIPLVIREESGSIPNWLNSEFGITGPVKYKDYLSFPFVLPVCSTPPGNWLVLRRLKQLYEEKPELRNNIRNYLQPLYKSENPSIDYNVLTIIERAQQDTASNAGQRR